MRERGRKMASNSNSNFIVDGVSGIVEGINDTIGNITKDVSRDTLKFSSIITKMFSILMDSITKTFRILLYQEDSIREAINVGLATNTSLDKKTKNIVIDFVISLMNPEKLISIMKNLFSIIQSDIQILGQIKNIPWYNLSESKANIEKVLKIMTSLVKPILQDDFVRLKGILEKSLQVEMPSTDDMIDEMIGQLETTIPVVALRMSESILYKTILNAADAIPGYSIFSTAIGTSSTKAVEMIIKVGKEMGLGIGNLIDKISIKRKLQSGGRRHNIHSQKILRRVQKTLYRFHDTRRRHV